MQDEHRPLSAALASKPDAPMHAREAAAEISEPATLKLGDIAERLGFALRGDFIADVLGVQPTLRERGASLYRQSDFGVIVKRLVSHLVRVEAGVQTA